MKKCKTCGTDLRHPMDEAVGNCPPCYFGKIVDNPTADVIRCAVPARQEMDIVLSRFPDGFPLVYGPSWR
jgi:hypothetical protein